jgi:hypothetical protein
MTWRHLLGMILCAVLSCQMAQALNPEPTGFAKLKFGISVDEARKTYPKMEKIERSRAGSTPNHPKVQTFLVAKQQVDGLEKPTDLELLFWDGKFWLALVHFGENDPVKIMEYLTKQFGAPGHSDDRYATWSGKTAAITSDRGSKYFEVHDERISNEARQEIFKGLLATGDALAPPTPAASPAQTAPGTASPAAATAPAAETPTPK